MTDTKSSQKTAIFAVVGVILLAILGFLAFKTISLSNENKELKSANTEVNQLKEELDQQYYEALSELEEVRGSNDELNDLVEQQKEELTTQRNKIDKLLSNKANLSKARKELDKLRAQVDQYVAELNQLREENAQLSQENSELNETNQTLTVDLDSQKMLNSELSSERATLVSEKQELEETKNKLSKKVNLASVIKLEDIEAYGLKTRSSGKAVKKSYAKNVQELRVCFNTTVNEVANPGTETFVLRIISPTGETMAVDAMGSGVFKNSATNEEMRFTKLGELDYDQTAENVCMAWAPDQAFQPGNYEIEIYNKGYLAGSTTLRLK